MLQIEVVLSLLNTASPHHPGQARLFPNVRGCGYPNPALAEVLTTRVEHSYYASSLNDIKTQRKAPKASY